LEILSSGARRKNECGGAERGEQVAEKVFDRVALHTPENAYFSDSRVRPSCIARAVMVARSAWRALLGARASRSLRSGQARPLFIQGCLPRQRTASSLRLRSTTVPSRTCSWAGSRERGSRRPVCSICWTGRG